MSPSLWLEPFLPTTAVEPVLPDPDAPDDPVAFREVSLAEAQVCCRSCVAASQSLGCCRCCAGAALARFVLDGAICHSVAFAWLCGCSLTLL